MTKSYNDEYFLKRAENRNTLAYENDFKFIKNNIKEISNILDFGCGEMLFTRFLLQLTLKFMFTIHLQQYKIYLNIKTSSNNIINIKNMMPFV